MSNLKFKKMSLPENWKWQTMGDISQVIGGGTPKTNEQDNFEGGNIPWLTPADMSGYKEKFVSKGARSITEKGLQTSSAKMLPAGSILFTSRAPIGYVGIALNEISTNQGFKSFVLKESRIIPDYVYWWLKGNKQLAESLASGTTFLELSGEKAKQLPIPIAPLDQQKQIVAKIEELFSHIDAGVVALQKAKKLLKQYRQSVLKAAVTGELTREWREQNKDKLQPASELLNRISQTRNSWLESEIKAGNSEARRQKSKLLKHEFSLENCQNIPDEWSYVSLLKLCKLVVDCHNKTAPYVENGIPLIRTSNVKDGRINFNEKMKYVDENTYTYWSRRCPPESGDILFTREAPMGESAIIPEGKKVCMGQRMMLFRVFHDFVEVNYFLLALMEPSFFKQLQEFKVGVGVQHLRVGDVERLVIALPPFEEQKMICNLADDRLNALSRLELEIDIQLKKAQQNKQSILLAAFSGKLVKGKINAV